MAVPILRPLFLVALFACWTAGVLTAAAQPARQGEPVAHPMVFYVAHGGEDACGPGCREWIAAEGEIDFGSANLLQRLLLDLGGVRLPVFFNSPGGRVITSMEFGRLVRARQLTVGVGHTIPLDCDPDPMAEKSCAARIKAGLPIEAELDPFTARCDSGCVFVLAGGIVRLIPPGVRLGIHDIGIDPVRQSGWSDRAIGFGLQSDRARLRNYMRLMGIDDQLSSEAFAIPNESLGYLSRDDAARFGMDPREFGETLWRFSDQPAPAIKKAFFVRTQGAEPHYVDGVVSLSCGNTPHGQYALTFTRALFPADRSAPSTEPPISIRLSDKQVSLSRQDDPTLYRRTAQLAPTTLDGVADDAAMIVPGSELAREAGPAGDITLTMSGFSAAYAKLQKACAQPSYGTSEAPRALRPLQFDRPRPGIPAWNNPNLAR
jgi:hypothetical protein